MKNINPSTKTKTSALQQFTNPARLLSIDTRRTDKLLRPFIAELSAAGLSVPTAAADIADRAYVDAVLALLTHPDCPSALLENLLTIETAALPENAESIDEAITRLLPNVNISNDPLERAMELFFLHPEELTRFRPAVKINSHVQQDQTSPANLNTENGTLNTGSDLKTENRTLNTGLITGPCSLITLLNSTATTLSRFVVLPAHAADTLALWILHTYAYQLRDVSTYIGIESPEKRCGKTTLLTVLAELTSRPVVASNISSPAFFRVIQETKPTLLIDEADTFLQANDEFRGILNSGYTRKTAYVIRVANDPGLQPSDLNTENRTLNTGSNLRHFSTWCPKAIAAIGRLPDTLSDRCIIIRMQRKIGSEPCERVRNLDGSQIRTRCEELIKNHTALIRSAQPIIPRELNDRAADLWEPLLVLADLAGGDWPERARRAALALSSAAQDHSPIGSLLFDLLLLFTQLPDNKKFFTRDIIEYLASLGSRPWSPLTKGKPITDLWLSAQFRPYGIAPKTVWIDHQSAKGYATDQFDEVFRRYIPRSEIEAKKAEIYELCKQRDEVKPAESIEPDQKAA